jgi:hypothetical protein
MPPFTWSVSRDAILHTCERRYYYQYLVTARYNSKTPLNREVALLKQLQSIPTWQGHCFHTAVKYWATAQRAGRNPSTHDMLAWLSREMGQQWQQSLSLVGQCVSRAEGSCRLFEHEYGVGLPINQLECCVAATTGWIDPFLAWAENAGIATAIADAKNCWIEPDTFGANAPGFALDGQHIVVKVDLAVQNQTGAFEIWDWKTGRLHEPNPRRIDPAALQVNVYQLWPHLKLGIPLEKIRAHLVYVAQNPTEDIVHEIDADVREFVLATVRRSIDRVLHFSGHTGATLEIEDFDYALSLGLCRTCNFKRICLRGLEKEESSDHSSSGSFAFPDFRD